MTKWHHFTKDELQSMVPYVESELTRAKQNASFYKNEEDAVEFLEALETHPVQVHNYGVRGHRNFVLAKAWDEVAKFLQIRLDIIREEGVDFAIEITGATRRKPAPIKVPDSDCRLGLGENRMLKAHNVTVIDGDFSRVRLWLEDSLSDCQFSAHRGTHLWEKLREYQDAHHPKESVFQVKLFDHTVWVTMGVNFSILSKTRP